MPVPVEMKQKREAEYRIQFMSRLSVLAADEVLSITQEVMGQLHFENKTVAAPFHAYCDHLLREGIDIKEGEYEPHPMYMRAYLLDLLRTIKIFILNIPRPNQIVEVEDIGVCNYGIPNWDGK
jgi:hypothetical protein